MIIGMGVDIIENARIKAAIKSSFSGRFIEKLFTEREVHLSNNKVSFFSGNFAAKEAFAKSLGTGFRGFMPYEVEVLRDNIGKPYIKLYGRALEKLYGLNDCFKQIGMKKCINQGICFNNIQVSITNTKDYACAFVIIEI